jgi:hypothetical protein
MDTEIGCRVGRLEMSNRLLVLLLLVVVGTAAIGHVDAQGRQNPVGFACHSRYFAVMSYTKHPDVVSPDDKSGIHLTKDFSFRVMSGGKEITTLSYGDMSCCLEVGWSPDSSQFFIMYSDGGAMGGFHTHIFRISGGRISESPVTRVVADRFQSLHYSTTPGINLYFLDWTPDSRDVFLIAEVPPESYYGKNMGFYTGFLADASSGEILRRFGEKETAAIEKNCRAAGSLGRWPQSR